MGALATVTGVPNWAHETQRAVLLIEAWFAANMVNPEAIALSLVARAAIQVGIQAIISQTMAHDIGHMLEDTVQRANSLRPPSSQRLRAPW